MTATMDLDRLVSSWLETVGPMTIDESVVEGALDRARRLPQRRGLRAFVASPAAWPRRRPTLRVLPPTIRLGVVVVIVVAAVVASAVVGSQLLQTRPAFPAPSIRPALESQAVVGPSPSSSPTIPLPSSSIDPLAHGRYTPAPDLLTPGTPARVLRLNDGRVLMLPVSWDRPLVGELFDPATGTGVNVQTPSEVTSAVVLRDGRVLMVGGHDLDPRKPGMSVLFDPTSGTTQATGDQVVPRAGAGLASLPDGRVLMVGGEVPHADGDEQPSITQAELFDPRTNTWSATGALDNNRIGASALATLVDGRVLVGVSVVPDGLPANVAGGRGGAELYDPATGRWTRAFTLELGQTLGRPLGLPDGRVAFVSGGWHGSKSFPAVPAAVDFWDPSTGRFGAQIDLPAPVSSLVLLDDGRIYLVGATDTVTTWSGIFDPRTGDVEDTGPTRAYEPRPVLLGDGRVLLVGGTTDGNLIATMGPDHRIPPDVATMEYFSPGG